MARLRASMALLLSLVLLVFGAWQSAAHAAAPPTGTQIRNIATATYTTFATISGGITVPPRSETAESNAVIAIIQAVEALTLTQSQNVTRAPGSVVTLSHLLTNTGNVRSSYTLGWANGGAGCAADSTDLSSLRLVRDLNNNGVIDPGDPVIASGSAGAVTLAAGDVAVILVEGVAPSGTAAAVACLSLTVASNSAQPASATNNNVVTIGNNAVMTLTKSASYPGLVLPGTTDISFTVTGASIGAQDAGPTATAASALLASAVVVDGVPQALVLIRDLIPAGTSYKAGTLSSTPTGAIKLFRTAGDAPYSYSSTDPGALAVEVAIGVQSALVRNGTLAMSFRVRVLSTLTGNIVNTSQSYYADGATPQEAQSNTVVIVPTILTKAIGIAKAASAPVIHLNAQGNADGTATVRMSLRVKNYGETALVDVNVTDLLEGAGATQFGAYTTATVPAANQYTIVAGSLAVASVQGVTGTVQIDPAFTGQVAHQKLLASGASLPPGSEFTLQFDVRVHVLSRSGTLLNIASASGALTAGGPTATTDQSTNGTDPDPDKDGDPSNNSVPTPVSTELPVLKLIKTASLPRQESPGVFELDYTFNISNVGNGPATNVQLIDNLNCTFGMDQDTGPVASWELVGAPVSLGRVLRPAVGSYTGRAACDRAGMANPLNLASVPTDPALKLLDGTVSLGKGQSDTVRITVRLRLKPAKVGQPISLSNLVWGTASSAYGAGTAQQVLAVTTASTVVLLADPMGVVYNSVSRQPVKGAVVTLSSAGAACPAGSAIGRGQMFDTRDPSRYTFNADGSVSMTTEANGSYQFNLDTSEACSYRLTVTPPDGSGYVFTSRLIPAQAGSFASCGPVTGLSAAPQSGEDTRHYLTIVAGGGITSQGATGAAYCAVSHNNIPLDPGNPEGLVLVKEGSKTQVEFGDFLDYALTATNKTGFALSGVRFTDALPPGFAYVPGSARLNGQPVADPAGGVGPSLAWNFASLAVAPQASATVRYRVRVGVGAPTEGEAINRARANSGPAGQIESNLAIWKVRISGGVFADEAYAFGKVMLNCKRDGVQNANDDQGVPGATDLGIPGVRLYLETGTFVVTDSEGKWSLHGLKPLTHVLRLDPTTLPVGAKLEVLDNRNSRNPESRFLDLKKGEFVKSNFIVGNCDDTAMVKEVNARRSAALVGPDPMQALVSGRLDAEGRQVIVSGDLRGMPASGLVAGSSALNLQTSVPVTSAPLIKLTNESANTASTFVSAPAGGLSGTLGASVPGTTSTMAAPAGSLFRPLQGIAAGTQPESVIKSGTVPGTLGSNALNTQTAPVAPLAQPMLPLAAPDSVDLEKLIPTLDNTLGFIGLKSGDTIASQQLNVRVKGAEGSSLRLTVNGVAIEERRVGKKSTLPSKRITAWEYIGVALKPGINSLRLEAMDDFGNVRGSQDISLTAPDKLSVIKIELPETARADQRTPAIVKVRLTDSAGVPVTARTQLTLESSSGSWIDEDLNPLEPGHQVFMEGGQAEFKLLPPGEPGEVRVRVSAGNLVNEVRLALLPEMRPMIAVGIIEGVLDFTKRGGLAVGAVPAGAAFERELTGLVSDSNDSLRAAARSAFFLKGTVRGDYLLTAAFDSDKTTKDRLFRDIRPDEFYPIYGDSSAKGFDAQSTQKLYLRIDKNRSYLLYGDFSTTSSTEVRQLSQSNRTLTGIKSVYETDQVRATSYVSRTSQTREVEEFRSVGTSGPYFLSAIKGDLVDNSERVEILVRDRNQPALVLQTTAVTRNVDYTIEPLTRRILFTRAIASIDGNLNPQSIRVSYEVDGGGAKFTVAGTDVQVKVGDNLQLGAVASIDNNPENQRKLQAVTAIARLGANTSLASEVVRTESDLKGTGNAARVELRYQDEQLAAVALASKSSAAFDNPGASAAAGRSEAAVRAEYKVDATTALRAEATYSKDEANNASNSAKSISASVQKKLGESLVAEVGVRHGQSTTGSIAGFDYGQVSTVNGSQGGTNGVGLATANTSQQEDVTTVRARMTSQVPGLPQAQVFVEAEQDLRHSDRHVLALGGNYALTDKTRAYGRYELVSTLGGLDALSTTGRTTGVLGIESNYMEGGRVFNEYRLADAIDGRSAQTAMGLRNTVKLNDQWRATGGIEHTRSLGGTSGNTGTGVAGVLNNDSTALISGIEYLGERVKASGVAEARVGSDAHTQLFSLGAAYKLDPDWSLLGRAVYSNSEGQGSNEGNDRLLTRYQIGVALRPVGQDVWNALARYEHKSERVRGTGTAAGAASLGNFSSASLPGSYSTDIVSAHLNYNPDRSQVITGRYAGKVSRADDGVTDSRYWANLLHARYTKDLNSDWDLGVQAGLLWGKGGASQRTLGVEVGYQVMKDLWLSAGYNWLGLKDRDLTGADYTSKGIYLRLRYKFDETGLGFAPAGAPRLVPPPAEAPAVAAVAAVAAVPMPVPEPTPLVAVQLSKTTLQAEAFFDFGKSVLKPKAYAVLDDLARSIKALNYEVVITIGHTDSVGTEVFNQKLSEQRAQAVRAYLVAQGIEASRITAEGRGESQPVADNRTAEGRALNRRVEIEVTGQGQP